MGYSLVITTHNRTDFVIDAFSKVLNNEMIDEIVIVDDFSNKDTYIELWNLVHNLNSGKIWVFRNTKNLGPMLNKYAAVKKSSNEWCVLLDSDNIIDNDYIEKIKVLEKKSDILYCPEILWGDVNREKVAWNYSKFRGLSIDKNNGTKYIDDGLFTAWLNTGNYFFNRQAYLDVIDRNKLDSKLMFNDAIYFSYLWLLCGNKMEIVPNLEYVHRVHKGSWYKNNRKACIDVTRIIKERL